MNRERRSYVMSVGGVHNISYSLSTRSFSHLCVTLILCLYFFLFIFTCFSFMSTAIFYKMHFVCFCGLQIPLTSIVIFTDDFFFFSLLCSRACLIKSVFHYRRCPVVNQNRVIKIQKFCCCSSVFDNLSLS